MTSAPEPTVETATTVTVRIEWPDWDGPDVQSEWSGSRPQRLTSLSVHQQVGQRHPQWGSTSRYLLKSGKPGQRVAFSPSTRCIPDSVRAPLLERLNAELEALA